MKTKCHQSFIPGHILKMLLRNPYLSPAFISHILTFIMWDPDCFQKTLGRCFLTICEPPFLRPVTYFPTITLWQNAFSSRSNIHYCLLNSTLLRASTLHITNYSNKVSKFCSLNFQTATFPTTHHYKHFATKTSSTIYQHG